MAAREPDFAASFAARAGSVAMRARASSANPFAARKDADDPGLWCFTSAHNGAVPTRAVMKRPRTASLGLVKNPALATSRNAGLQYFSNDFSRSRYSEDFCIKLMAYEPLPPGFRKTPPCRLRDINYTRQCISIKLEDALRHLGLLTLKSEASVLSNRGPDADGAEDDREKARKHNESPIINQG